VGLVAPLRVASAAVVLVPAVARDRRSDLVGVTVRLRADGATMRAALLTTSGVHVDRARPVQPEVVSARVVRIGVLVMGVVRIGVLVMGVVRIGVLVMGVVRIGVLVVRVVRIGVLVVRVVRIGVLVMGVVRIGVLVMGVGRRAVPVSVEQRRNGVSSRRPSGGRQRCASGVAPRSSARRCSRLRGNVRPGSMRGRYVRWRVRPPSGPVPIGARRAGVHRANSTP
jgi:hypothetical protein